MTNKFGVMVCGHGSRDKDAVNEFKAVARGIKERLPQYDTNWGFLEFAKPVINSGLDVLRDRGVRQVLAVPGMLFAAGHAKNDIPSVLNAYQIKNPSLSISYGRELGIDLKLIRAAGERVESALKKSNDLINLINWIRIFSPNDMKIKELINTYEKHQNWPKINYARVLIEKKIKWENEKSIYYDFLSKNQPLTALGKIKLHHYYYDKKREKEKIINNWINNSFSKEDEIYIKKKYKNIFNINVSVKRLNNLIWKKKWSSAYRELKTINDDNKNLFRARIKLARREYGVDSAINKVSENLLNDEGLIYERIKWRSLSNGASVGR